MFTSPYQLELTAEQRIELEKLSRSRRAPAAIVRRAPMILAIADRIAHAEFTERFNTSTITLTHWRKRYVARGLAGLTDELKPGRGDRITAKDEARILVATQKPPPKPLTHWTSRRLAKELDYGHATITTDLRRKLMAYIRLHNRHCRPFQWTYRNTRRRIHVNTPSETVH